ncbi:MAG: RHS repeat-associated core domain-containing protein [Phycisphaerales bacterium]
MFDYYCGTTACLPGGEQPDWPGLFDEWETSCQGSGDPPDDEIQPKPGEGGGGGPDEGCDDDETAGLPRDDRPVDLFYGDKVESTTDLRVRVTGRDFGVARDYTSDPEYSAHGLVGEGWGASPFRFVTFSIEGGGGGGAGQCCSECRGGTAGGGYCTLGCMCDENDEFPDEFDVQGPTGQRWEKATLDVGGGTTYPVWRHIEPGQWEVDFYRVKESGDPGGTTDPDPDIVGLRLETRDMYGNAHEYEYEKEGTPAVYRLKTIKLNEYSGALHPEALIKFHWNHTAGSVNVGRLEHIQVLRYDKDDAEVETQLVSYTYMDECDTSFDAALGLNGDLVQVVRKVRVDPDPGDTSGDPFWRKYVTQYRYHNAWADNEISDALGDQDGFFEKGNAHQLKMVILPEQIEFAAQQEGENDSAEIDVEAYAAELLDKADGADAWNGQTGDKVIVADLAAKMIEEYEEWKVTDPTNFPGRIKTQYLQSNCGCGGGSTQGLQLTYEYFSWDSGDGHTTKITEKFKDAPWTLHRTLYYDTELKGTIPGAEDKRVPYLVTKAIIDGTLKWVTHYIYDDDERTVLRKMTPSAMSTYTPATATTAPSYTASTSSGLVYAYKYTAKNYRSEVRLGKGFLDTSESNLDNFAGYTLLTRNTYDTMADFEYIVEKVERLRVELTGANPNPNADDVEITDFAFGYHTSGAHDVAWVKTTVEAEEVKENGPDGTYVSYELLNSKGNNYWSIAADGSYTKRIYDTDDSNSVSLTGGIVEIRRNADTSIDSYPSTNVPPSPPGDRFADGGSLSTKFVRDLLGRTQKQVTPGDIKSYILREMRTFPGRSYIKYYAEITLPHEFGSPKEYNGPGTITWYNGYDNVIGTSDYEIESAYSIAGVPTSQSGYTVVITDYDLDGDEGGETGQLARAEIVHDVSGLITSRAEWHSLAGLGRGSGIYTTKFFYDSLGRLDYSINPEGTVIQNTFDVLDRVIKAEVGIASGENPSNMNDVVEFIFDGSGDTQGDGNGNLTRVKQLVNSTAGDNRVTDSTYDFRDRLIKAVNPDFPHEFVEYDNLDRVIHRGVFQDTPADNHDFEATDTNRKQLVTTHYSQRGLVYRTQLAIDPTAAYVAATHSALETHSWFDEAGRPVGTWAPNGPGTKMTFDGLGRPVVSYTTDREGDADPGAAGNHADVYDTGTHVAKVNGDVVLEQTEYGYIAESASAHEGQMDLATMRYRTHDADDTKTGDLKVFVDSGAEADNQLVITTYVGSDFDDADRTIRSINFGTGDDTNDDFRYDGPVPTKQAAPNEDDWDTSDGFQLVTATAYNSRGLVESSTSPDGDIAMYFFDDLNRRIVVVENRVDIDEDDIDWDLPNQTPDRWVIDDVGGTAGNDLDQDRAISYVYDGINNVIVQTAHQPEDAALGDQDQVTEYVYGVTTAETPGGSDLYSNDLLRQVIYPDIETSETDPDHSVYYSYNRAGELIFSEDQNTTEHTYTRDKLGRVTEDDATALGTNIDGAIRSLTTDYTLYGLVELVKSLDSIDAVQNAVKFEYNGLWQVTKVHQEINGDVDGSTLKVQYTYDTNDMDEGNFSRLDKTTYPDGADFGYGYGTADTSDEDISRVVTQTFGAGFGATPLVTYDHIGLSMFAEIDLDDIDVQLDRTASHGGKRQTQGNTDNPGLYPGYDRFGRVVRQTWVDGNFTEHATPSSDYGNIPPIVELEYTYDKDSNRTAAYDDRPGAVQELSHEYTYDGIDRLTEAVRGLWDGSTLAPKNDSQKWALDMLGNWDSIDTDLNGNGVYTDANEQEDRDHDDPSDANELDTRTLVGQGPGGSDFDLDLTYDKAGNLRTEVHGNATSIVTWTYTHDAWNRLVKVVAASTKAEYEYNGLNWRIIKRADTPGSASGLDQQRMMYYSTAWQLLEERIDDDSTFPTDPNDADIDRHVQYVWGQGYIDNLLLHREDGDVNGTYDDTWYHPWDEQYSTVAILDDAAALVERVTYDAYGNARHHYMADWDGDGDVTQAEINQIRTVASGANHAIGESNYNPDMDINRDGDVARSDYTIANTEGTHSALAKGLLSDPSVDNQIGWDGYVFNAETRQYLARNRFYDPVLGRWLERDPLGTLASNPAAYVLTSETGVDALIALSWRGHLDEIEISWGEILSLLNFDPETQYDDGFNLYQYGRGGPIVGFDPAGGPWWVLVIRGAASGGKWVWRGGKWVWKKAIRPSGRWIGRKSRWLWHRCAKRHAAVQAACKVAKGRCTGEHNCAQLAARIVVNKACITARRAMMKKCWRKNYPGYDGQKKALRDAKRALKKCVRLLATCKC